MRAQASKHIRAHIWEHTEVQTYASTHKSTGKMPDPHSGTYVLCAPAQSKRAWTLHKSHFVWKFTGKMPDPLVNTSIEHRAFHCDRKNPFSVATLFGEKV